MRLAVDDLEQAQLKIAAIHKDHFGGNHGKLGVGLARLEQAIDLVGQVANGLRDGGRT